MTHQQQGKPISDFFERGSLWRRMTQTANQALKAGALEPIRTTSTYCEQNDIRFLIRVVSSLREKPPGTDEHNPFLPYEKALHVADATSTHVCVLNKYNVVENHLLITTREFEHQETALTLDDFLALVRCMAEFDSLGFYNSGLNSGASQKHKHLQLVPLPVVPVDAQGPACLHAVLDGNSLPMESPCRTDAFPFRHAFAHFKPAEDVDLEAHAAKLHALYRATLSSARIDLPDDPADLVATPYNLLVTNRWMLVVPRLQECFEDISLNSLAFLGALLVQDHVQLDQLRRAGPFAALSAVTHPLD